MVNPREERGDTADEPVADFGLALRVYNPTPPPVVRTPDEVWNHWIGVLRHRIEARWHNVVVITGEPGCGKSTLALQLARGVERDFAPDQVAYSATDMLGLYRRLGHGQVAVYDEAILGLLSNDFQTPEARELVKAVNIVRAKGITVLLCISDIYRLLAAWREEAVQFWIHCESDPRGVGWMHQRRQALHYERRTGLGLYKDQDWNPVRWSTLEGTTFWRDYERQKLARIDRFMDESMVRLHPAESRERDRQRRRTSLRRLLNDGYTEREARDLTGADWEEVKQAYRELRDRGGRTPSRRRRK